jgi:two-component system sensor histidine kinase KdpD
MDDRRPDPDRLLMVIRQDRSLSDRGRLRIFFGAAAGVGKTFAMLLEAQQQMGSGNDVVVGVVETHGREETQMLLQGLPIIPLKPIEHRGIHLYELDLEAALERKPSLILVDELAHTNAPGSRHMKRWQDVEELLTQGINVYTTLNVQHLESMNDIVANITGTIVRETIPDTVFDAADEVSLIDIPSDELIKRLMEGKVYVDEGEEVRAAEHFFRKPNLVALRELALRRMAERVDAESDTLTAASGKKEFQLGQKILVCVGHDALSTRVIRHGRRIASRSKAPWYVLYVETSRHERLTEDAKLNVERNLRFAARMGARVVHLTGTNALHEILNYAKNYGFTQIVVGYQAQAWIRHWIQGSLPSELIRYGSGLEIITVTETTPFDRSFLSLGARLWKEKKASSHYILALIWLGLTTLLGLMLRDFVDFHNIIMFYLTCVVIVAARLGMGPSILISFLSVVAFNIFFIEPYHTFSLHKKGYSFIFLVMLLTSLIVGSQAGQLFAQAERSRRRERDVLTLYGLTRQLAMVREVKTMIQIALTHVREAFQMETVIFIPKNGRLSLYPENSSAHTLKEESVAHWVLNNNQFAGHNTDTLPSARGLYLPLSSENETLGVLGLIPPSEDYNFTTSEISQLETFALLIASALQRSYRGENGEIMNFESMLRLLREM